MGGRTVPATCQNGAETTDIGHRSAGGRGGRPQGLAGRPEVLAPFGGGCRAVSRRAPMEFCVALPRTSTGKADRTRRAKRNR